MKNRAEFIILLHRTISAFSGIPRWRGPTDYGEVTFCNDAMTTAFPTIAETNHAKMTISYKPRIGYVPVLLSGTHVWRWAIPALNLPDNGEATHYFSFYDGIVTKMLCRLKRKAANKLFSVTVWVRVEPVPTCKKCGTPLDADGYCGDKSCPYFGCFQCVGKEMFESRNP